MSISVSSKLGMQRLQKEKIIFNNEILIIKLVALKCASYTYVQEVNESVIVSSETLVNDSDFKLPSYSIKHGLYEIF